MLPQYNSPLAFMQYRMSLFIAILLCAVVSGGAHGRSLTRVSGLLASLFFTLTYLDARSLNRVEADLCRFVFYPAAKLTSGRRSPGFRELAVERLGTCRGARVPRALL